MSMSGPNETKEQHGQGDAQGQAEQDGGGHSGEGAASAMAQVISRNRQDHRHQAGEAEDAAGSHHQ